MEDIIFFFRIRGVENSQTDQSRNLILTHGHDACTLELQNVSLSDDGFYMCKLFRPKQHLNGNGTAYVKASEHETKSTNFSVRVTIPFKMGIYVSDDDNKNEVDFVY